MITPAKNLVHSSALSQRVHSNAIHGQYQTVSNARAILRLKMDSALMGRQNYSILRLSRMKVDSCKGTVY